MDFQKDEVVQLQNALLPGTEKQHQLNPPWVADGTGGEGATQRHKSWEPRSFAKRALLASVRFNPTITQLPEPPENSADKRAAGILPAISAGNEQTHLRNLQKCYGKKELARKGNAYIKRLMAV